MVTVSIIMPVYNASKYLDTSIKSILRQDSNDIEVICIDDGSTDNSLNILEKYAKQYKFIKIFSQENKGPAISRNKGINEAKGEYLAFLDADDKFLDNKALKHMYEVGLENDADVVCANLRRIKQNGQLDEDYDYTNSLFTYFTRESVLKSYEYGIPWAFYKNIYKRDFLINNNISFPNFVAGEDPIFLASVLTSIDNIFTVNMDLYGYNHSVSGGLNIKLNTYKKRKEYITHFIETFKILEKKGFENVLADYKKEFIDYLNFRDNINNQDIIDIVKELFADDIYFKDSDYGYLIISILKGETIDEDDEYNLIKYCLFEESMLEDVFIEPDRLKDYVKINESNGSNENKASFKQLKEIEDETFEEKRKINGTVDKLKLDITHYIKSNNRILTSNSWKFTSLLRNIKQKNLRDNND